MPRKSPWLSHFAANSAKINSMAKRFRESTRRWRRVRFWSYKAP
jgi:hypothetical protein